MSRGPENSFVLILFVLCGMLLAPAGAYATNGLNLLGFGAESSLMAGADVAVARDAAALNTNPAGIAQLRMKALDVYGATAHALDVGHADRFGNDVGVSNKFVHVAGFGYAHPRVGSEVVFGFGAFVQGGAGSVFERMITPFGTVDELSSQFGAFKPTVGAAWRPNDRLMIGAAVSMFIARLEQKVFPATSVFTPGDPTQTFFGSSLKNASGVGFGMKIGAMYELSPTVTLGATYTSKTRLPLKHGDLVVNMTSAGLGQVAYREARIDGFAFPHQVAAGVAWRPSKAWLWALKLEWLNWAGALNSSTLTATGPSNPAAPAVLTATQTLDWRDQFVVAVGVAFEVDSRTTLRAGVNYGRNPVRSEHGNPLLNAIGERHLTLGMSRKLTANYELHGGIEYVFRNRMRYFNRELPFGPDAEMRNEHVAFHVMLSRRW